MEDLTAQSLFSLKGWVAVVTGGGSGLGLMTARALAANGAKVYITGRRREILQAAETSDFATGGSIVGVQMDCTDKESIQNAVQSIAVHEKFINLLVNNAGKRSVSWGPGRFAGLGSTISDISKSMMETQTFNDWTEVYKLNVASYYFTSVAFLPLLVAARDSHGFTEAGSILNIASISGIAKDSQNGQFSYNASKAAVISLSRQLALELKRPDIEVRVNVLAPGYFPSEMNPIARDSARGKEYFRGLDIWGIPCGRAGTPRDYAQAILSLAVNEYVTGSELIVDGGWLLAHA